MFTLRTFSTYWWGFFRPFEADSIVGRVLQFCLIFAHHLVVDEITRRYGPEDKTQTTVRVQENNKRAPWQVLRFFAFYQFSALGSTLLPNARLPDLAYNQLIAIQSSAFLMTLFRKGLVRWYSHLFWYSVALILSFNYMRIAIPGYFFWCKILICFLIRIKGGMDKYAIWMGYILWSIPDVEQVVFHQAKALINPHIGPFIMGTN